MHLGKEKHLHSQVFSKKILNPGQPWLLSVEKNYSFYTSGMLLYVIGEISSYILLIGIGNSRSQTKTYRTLSRAVQFCIVWKHDLRETKVLENIPL